MTIIEDVLFTLNNTIILENSALDYIIAVLVFGLSFVILKIIKRFLIDDLSKVEWIQESKLLYVTVETLENYISNSFILVVSFYFATVGLVFPSFLNSVIITIVFATITWFVLKFFLDLLDAVVEIDQKDDDENIHILEFFRVIIRAFLIVMATILFLGNMGFDVTSFLAGLGIVSLAIAFALRATIGDIFASFVILIDQPFQIGDSIKVDDDSGTVEEIGIRSSKIRASAGYVWVASNRELTGSRIHNLKKASTRRATFTFGISLKTSPSQLMEISEFVENRIRSVDELIFEKINLREIGEFSYNFELVYSVNSRNYTVFLETKQDLLYSLLQYFKDEKIEMPYPTKTIIIED